MWKYNSADTSFAGHPFFGVGGGGGCIAEENRTVAGWVCTVCDTLLAYHWNAMSIHSHFCYLSVQFL